MTPTPLAVSQAISKIFTALPYQKNQKNDSDPFLADPFLAVHGDIECNPMQSCDKAFL